MGRDAAVLQQQVQSLDELRRFSLSRGANPVSGSRSAGGRLGEDYFFMNDGVSLTARFGGGGGGGFGLNGPELNGSLRDIDGDEQLVTELASRIKSDSRESFRQRDKSGESDRKDALEEFAADDELLVGLQETEGSMEQWQRRDSELKSFDINL